MSRSYKKHPIVKDHSSGKWGKKQSNRAVRNKEEAYKRSNYKKVYPSWDIHDYISYYSKEMAIEDWYVEEARPKESQFLHNKYGTLEKWLIAWEKTMLKK